MLALVFSLPVSSGVPTVLRAPESGVPDLEPGLLLPPPGYLEPTGVNILRWPELTCFLRFMTLTLDFSVKLILSSLLQQKKTLKRRVLKYLILVRTQNPYG